MPTNRRSEEQARLAALDRLRILDTPAEDAFDRITRIAADLFRVPAALVTFIDKDRQWFKSRLGFGPEQTSRDIAFCAHTIRESGVLVVPDAAADARFRDNPLVAGEPHIRFYAGAPITMADGHRVGTIAVLDHVPHPDFSERDREALSRLAAILVDALQLRLMNAVLREERRAFQEQRLLSELLIEGSAEGIFAVDRAFRCTLWNPAIAQLTGLPRDEVLGRNICDVPCPLSSSRAEAALESAINGRAMGIRDEPYRRPDGTEHFFSAHLSPLRDAEGNNIGVIGFVRDTTERQQLEAQLRQSQKMEAVGRLTGSVAHDFNNLLTVVIGSLELATARARDDPKLGQLLSDASEAAVRGEKLAQQLLAFARRQRLDPQPIDVNALVLRMLPMLERTMSAKIAVRTDFDPHCRTACADPHQIEIAVLNLAINAHDAMPNGGTLTLRTRNRALAASDLPPGGHAGPGDFVMLSVQDTGVGMTEDVVRRIFEPFFTTKESGRGTGLGLSQVYGFVVQSHGHISVKSAPGAGTSIEIYLPVADETVSVAGQERADARKGGGEGGGATILIVEDDPEVRKFAANALAGFGYRTLAANDARSGLTLAATCPEIDLVFSDVVMPGGMSGLDMVRELRRRSPRMKAILTTGYTDVIGDIRESGIPLLMKPYRPSELLREIRSVLRSAEHGSAPSA